MNEKERVDLERLRVAMHEQRQRAEQAEQQRDAFAEVDVERESARQAAERERDVARRGMKAVSARLARVPALVEAAYGLLEHVRNEACTGADGECQGRCEDAGAVRAALAEWEQA